ncbi:MAG: hydrogenase maturation protease [Desulfobacteraceae bacterium]|nr:hydrogenase maturation protease [Desulfobacteraceae bacterium]
MLKTAKNIKAHVHTLILGTGNLLLRDEGVGVHAVRELSRTTLPKGIKVLSIGTAFLDALPAMENSKRLIVIDAMKASGKPGTVYRVALDSVIGPDRMYSMHGFDIFRMLVIAKRSTPLETVVFGVEPDIIGWGTQLSPRVHKSMPVLLDAVYKEIESVHAFDRLNSQ